MAIGPDGTVVTVWEQWDPDRNVIVVMAQAVAFDGEVIHEPYRVNPLRVGEMSDVRHPAISFVNGKFVVAYEMFVAAAPPAQSVSTIEIVTLGSTGEPPTSDNVIHTNGNNRAEDVKVIGLADGRSFVMWEQDGAVFGRYVSAAGIPEAITFELASNSFIDNSGLVGTAVGSTFVAGWVEQIEDNQTNLVLRFNRSNDPITITIKQYNNASATARDLEITALGQDRVLVTWVVENGNGTSIIGQVFSVNGVQASTEFTIDTSGPVEAQPVVASLGGTYLNSDGFVVTWVETVNGVNVIKAQIFSGPGAKVGAAFVVSDEIEDGTRINPQIISHGDGRFTVTWTTAWNASGGYLRSQTFDTRANGINWTGDARNDSYVGTKGDDILSGGGGSNRLSGHDGNDTLTGGALADTLKGGFGNDQFNTSDGADHFNGGSGRDTVSYWGLGPIAIYMTKANDSTGQAKGDTFTGIEVIDGGTGNDTIEGNGEANAFWGDDGNDQLYGLDGNDTLQGGKDNDYLVGGAGADKLDGGAGTRDTASYYGASKGVEVYLEHMQDNTNDAAGDTYFDIEVIDGSTHGDVIAGNTQANHFWGDAGNDILSGLAGGDTLSGGAGDDILIGGLADRIHLRWLR